MTRLPLARVRVPVFLLALACLAGCGGGNPKTYRIPGRLVYDDGKPVPGATIVFQTTHDGKKVAARGLVNPDGTFELTTFSENDGVLAGEHEVTVVPLPPQDGAKPAKPVVQAKYADFESSRLTFTVAPDTKEIVVTISR